MKKILSIIFSLLLSLSAVWTCGCATDGEGCSAYDISITYADKKVEGVMTLDYYNDTDNALKELKFNLYANAFREGAKYSPVSPETTSQAYYKDLNYGGMTINSVTSYDDELTFSVGGEDETLLTVELKEEVYPSERAKVVIDYSITLAEVVARTGINRHTVNLANFYPVLCAYDTAEGFYECLYYDIGDPYYSECADYFVSVTCDGEYAVASSGKLKDEKKEGSLTTRKYEISSARSFALVLSKEFECITDTSTGVEINYYFYDDQTSASSMETAVKSVKLFSEKFGKYPYPTYSVVQTEFVQGGMEFPALVMIADELEKPAYHEVIAHETAHQWWQTAVGNNEIEYGFLDEGLAEYSVVLFYENYPEYGLNREQLISASEKTYKIYCSVFEKLFNQTDTKMLKSLKDFKGEYEYVNLAYVKPCIMYDYLRQTVGEVKFFNGLKKYYQEFIYKNATPDDLVGVFERLGADTNGFFNSFFEGKVVI